MNDSQTCDASSEGFEQFRPLVEFCILRERVFHQHRLVHS